MSPLALRYLPFSFGTRNLDVNERHYGVVMAIAVEAVVKLFALLAVGVFVVWFVADGPADILERIRGLSDFRLAYLRRALGRAYFPVGCGLLVLAADVSGHGRGKRQRRPSPHRELGLPTYLMVMSLFVVPIAVVGLELLPEGSNPDLFVLTVSPSHWQRSPCDVVLHWRVFIRLLDGDCGCDRCVYHGV